jgi:hypothetical protein
LTNCTLKIPNGQLNKNIKSDVFMHVKKNGGNIIEVKTKNRYGVNKNVIESMTKLFELI